MSFPNSQKCYWQPHIRLYKSLSRQISNFPQTTDRNCVSKIEISPYKTNFELGSKETKSPEEYIENELKSDLREYSFSVNNVSKKLYRKNEKFSTKIIKKDLIFIKKEKIKNST